jgi:hypothetical protein
MPLFEDTDQDEIRRLRTVIAKLEKTKGVRIVTVEMVPRQDRAGHLFYITAPTMASEEVFGLALAETIQKAFRVIGAEMRSDVVGGDHIAPPSEYSVIDNARDAACHAVQGALGRWVIVKAAAPHRAWSGCRWVPHREGIPVGGAQVCNFDDWQATSDYAQKAGLAMASYVKANDGKSITCLECGMTSFNENDVLSLYCGNCHKYHSQMKQ